MLFGLETSPWLEILGAAGTVMGAATAALWKIISLFVDHLKARDEAQRLHDKEMMERFEKIDEKQNNREMTIRAELRQMIDTQFAIQRETVGSIADLGHRVGELGSAITEMRHQLAGKADKDSVKDPRV